ncbi:MAG: lysophospholipid acyltransferase family protein [Bdellovibrionales bacterium]
MVTLLSYLGRFWLYISGWKIVGNPLPANKYVLVVAYHTSNWDFPICVATRTAVKAPVSWIGKHTLFWGPLGPVMRLLGGVPVNRNLKTDIVGQVVAQFRAKEKFGVAIFPEGTRKRVSRWKTGFYQIALQAGVPIQPAVLDYKTKSFVFGPLFYPSGNYQFDMEFLKHFFRMANPAYPEYADMDFDTSVKAQF